jgi:class 3 adenylate cyclase/tetratricopeptide (TPR) repeat protein
MRCPRCAQENRPERRFCGGCGAALPLACTACGFANEADAKFCGGCGRPVAATADPGPALASRPEPPGERRQVTILFADLVGFTQLSRSLDAEELHGLMAQFFDAVDRVIASYGGSVDKHIGDAVMALFGAPVAHGDDPLRALRAALDIHDAVGRLGSELRRPLSVHIGIAGGEVVAAGLGSDRHNEYTVLGDAVNLAARLVETARSGETLLDDSVRRLVGPIVECVGLGEVALRGLEKPVVVWRLEALRADAADGTPFVGRRGEQRQIAGILDLCQDTGRGQAVLLRGEAGIGKTRLMTEIASAARSQGFGVHVARVLDFGTGTGRDAARILARSLLGLEPASNEAQRQAAVDAVLADGRLSNDRRPFLVDLLDLPAPLAERAAYDAMDNATRNRGKQQTLAALLTLAARERPLLIAVEDIHWAEPHMLAHLAALAIAVRDVPVVLTMTTRIEGDPLTGVWRAAARSSPLVTIDLGPLARDEALALAGSFLDATNRIALTCVERADGNPLFLEQLLRNAEAAERADVPASIQSLVLGRMDRLPPADRIALQAASIAGQYFTLDLLRHLVGDPGYDAAALVEHHLVRPEEDGFLFAHALVRDGVYGALLRPRRRELHRRAAAWFEQRDPVLAAQHLDRAEDPRAASAYLTAARVQAAGYHNDRALALTERGLAIATAVGDRHALACRRAELLHDLGRTAESIEAFQRALDIADTDAQRCQAWIGLAAGMRVADRYDEALGVLEQAEAVAAGQQIDSELARIHYLRGNIYFPLGRIEACRREHELSLDHARKAGSAEGEARALSGLGDAYYAAGCLLSAAGYFSRCVTLAREHGFGRIEVANRSMAAMTLMYAGDLDAARTGALEAVEAAARVGHQRAEMVAGEIAYIVLFEEGDLDRAEAYARRSLELSRRLGARRFEAEDLTFLAQALRTRGHRAAALTLLDDALGISRDVGMEYIGALILAEIAATTDDPERRAAALAEGEAELARRAVSHAHLWFYRCAMDLSLEQAHWAEAERYALALEDYTRAEPMPWSDFYVARGRALAAWGKGVRSGAAAAELCRLAAQAERYGFARARLALDEAARAS